MSDLISFPVDVVIKHLKLKGEIITVDRSHLSLYPTELTALNKTYRHFSTECIKRIKHISKNLSMTSWYPLAN